MFSFFLFRPLDSFNFIEKRPFQQQVKINSITIYKKYIIVDINKSNRAKYDFSIKRYIKILIFKSCNVIPVSRFLRAKIYRILGVSIEKGVVRIGKISIDTIHPEDIFIGKGTAIADGCILLSHYYDVYNLKEHAYYRGQIHIGRNGYIASNTIFTKPVTIGDGAIIGAGSIVNKDIPPYTVWGGAPARFICNRYKEELEIPVNTELFKPR